MSAIVYRQAITCKYIGPTNFKGSRIVARASAGRIIFDYRSELSTEGNSLEAAKVLMKKFNWNEHSKIIGGGVTHTGNYVFILGVKK